jgi:hypothetical protein
LLASSDSLAYGSGQGGCSFVPLDGDGNEIGPVDWFGLPGPDAYLPPSGGSSRCVDPGPAPDGGFTYLQQAPFSGGTSDLVTLGTNGSVVGSKTLGTVPGFDGRLVLDDESFLLTTLYPTDSANEYSWQVTHYDAQGVQLAPATAVATSENFVMAETSRGVLAAYVPGEQLSGQPVYVVPLSRDGVPTTTPVALAVTGTVGPLFYFSLAPSPSGDAVLSWANFEGYPPSNANGYSSFAMELDPGGGQRGPALNLGSTGGSLLVGDDGERALFVYSVSTADGAPTKPAGGVHTLPLACAAH